MHVQVPGLNPLQNQQALPGALSPLAPQPGVPDLILDAPRGAHPPPAQTPTQAPYQAPHQPLIQHSVQDMAHALMEMGITPSNQNLSIAQNLANYGHPVNHQSIQIVQQALAGLPDRSAATIEASVILLTQDLPVNSQNVMAIKQFMHAQALPQQLQNLPRELAPVLQQMQSLPPLPASGQSLPTTVQDAPTAPLPAPVSPQTSSTPLPSQAHSPSNPIPANTNNPPAVSPGPAQMSPPLPAQGNVSIPSAPQVGQNSVVQQIAGYAQAIEHRSDNPSRLAEQQSTALKVQAQELTARNPQPLNPVDTISERTPQQQNLNITQHLPQAYSQQEQKALEQLYLYLSGSDPHLLEALHGQQQVLPSPDEGIYRMFQLLGHILQISAHLAENMQLKDYHQLFIQHQQIIQLTGLLEEKIRAFQQLFHSTFPLLAQNIQKHLHSDGLDIFSKLAQLIENNQAQLKQQLKHTAGDVEKQQLLNTLRDLLEQVGFQIDKVQAQLTAREILSQNQPIHCIPLLIHANQEHFPAELYIRQDYDPRNTQQGPDGQHPLHLTLTLETKNLGRVSADIRCLKQDLQLQLKVLTRRVKIAMDERLHTLQKQIEAQGHYHLTQLSCVVEPDLESRQSMLLPPKRQVRTLRRIEGVV